MKAKKILEKNIFKGVLGATYVLGITEVWIMGFLFVLLTFMFFKTTGKFHWELIVAGLGVMLLQYRVTWMLNPKNRKPEKFKKYPLSRYLRAFFRGSYH